MIPIILGIILALTHYFSDKIHLKYYLHKTKLVSFAAGISITFIFLDLFPELFRGTEYFHRLSISFLLIGFVLFHVIEKHVYRHSSRRNLKKELEIEHSIAFFIYHFIIGIVLALIIKASIIKGMLFFIPLFFHMAISSVSMNEIKETIRDRIHIKLLLSASTLLGVLVTLIYTIPLFMYHSLVGFVVGALLYIIIRDFIPKEKEGNPLFFVSGVVIYSLLIGLTWILY